MSPEKGRTVGGRRRGRARTQRAGKSVEETYKREVSGGNEPRK